MNRAAKAAPEVGDTKAAAVHAFVDELARLYAELWFSGKLNQVRKESEDAEAFDDE